MGHDDLAALAAAFATGAGFEAIEMSLLIRGLLAAAYMIWAAWVAYKQFILMADEKLSFADYRMNMIRLSLSITVILVLVSIV